MPVRGAKTVEDDRLKREDLEVVGQRTSRRSQERQVTESRELTEDDRLAMFRNTLFNDALPDLPNIPGYHTCWLTTSNPSDPIHRRVQLGYELLRADEVPGLEYASLKTGDYAGIVGVNEMIAAKLPMSLYQGFMQEAHHRRPAEEEEMLSQKVQQMRQDAEGVGAKLIAGDGMEELHRSAPSRGVFEG